MNCQKIQKRLPHFLKSELEAPEEKEMLDHLNACVDCRFVYQELRQKMQEDSGSAQP